MEELIKSIGGEAWFLPSSSSFIQTLSLFFLYVFVSFLVHFNSNINQICVEAV